MYLLGRCVRYCSESYHTNLRMICGMQMSERIKHKNYKSALGTASRYPNFNELKDLQAD